MAYANYAWIITQEMDDFDHEPVYDNTARRYKHSIPKKFRDVNVAGPRNMHPDTKAALEAGQGQAFQLWDDDGVLVYRGRWFEDCTEAGFAGCEVNGFGDGDPLGDYGAPNWGCTEMTVGNMRGFIS